MIARTTRQTLAGWARRPRASVALCRPERVREVREMVAGAAGGSLIARGGGTAYGDAALNDDRYVLSTERLRHILAFDVERGLITCQAGVRLHELLEVALPRGWFLSVTPGTANATVGGCFACDCHGKNHEVDGSFAEHVTEVRLVTGTGEAVTCSPSARPDLFWATAGGLGLTGVILQLTLVLRPVASAFIRVRYRKAPDLEATFRALTEAEPAMYSVAWIDSLARGPRLGRSVLMLGEHAEPAELAAAGVGDRPALRSRLALAVPCALPGWLLARPLVAAFNAAYYARFPVAGTRLEPLERYFYPLDAVRRWNLAYGRHGFVQYQFVAPGLAAYPLLRRILDDLSAAGYGSFLAVIKRLRAGNPAMLSFPAEGFTLAVDIPARDDRLWPVLRGFDERVAECGGRVYLAKDSRLDPRCVDAMYPRRREWARIVEAHDPARLFESSLSRRLGLRDLS